MTRLLKKEFSLCLHPTAPLFLMLGAMVLIPNYPYSVNFFYTTLGIFFICMTGRENHDIPFTMTLPVSRRQLVAGRMLLCAILQGAQLALCAILIALRPRIMDPLPNPVGMDANWALLGEGLLVFALFNAVFFPLWYRDVRKVGVPFLIASAAVFLFILAAIASTYALPFVRDQLDTPDPDHLPAKLLFIAVCALAYALSGYLSFRVSCRRFEAQDLQT